MRKVKKRVYLSVCRRLAGGCQEAGRGAMLGRWGALVALAVLVLSAAAHAQIPPLGSMGAPDEKNLADRLDQNKPEEAARYWGENRSYFWDNAEQNKALLQRLKIAVNTP